MATDRSARGRFGGTWGWYLKDSKLPIGEIIEAEGPGQGFALMPWALDKYERALRLRPAESWLMRRLLKHAWEFGAPVFISLRRTAIEADVSRSALQGYMTRLIRLGYVRVVSVGVGLDRRKRYDVSGLYAALALCIAADPTSEWAKAFGVLPVERARSLTFAPPGVEQRWGFDLDFDALRLLAQRAGLDEEEDAA